LAQLQKAFLKNHKTRYTSVNPLGQENLAHSSNGNHSLKKNSIRSYFRIYTFFIESVKFRPYRCIKWYEKEGQKDFVIVFETVKLILFE
jgi:hypothetical protein